MLTLRDIASLSQDLQRLHRKCCEEHANLVKQRNAFFHQVLVQRRKFQEEASMKVRQYEAQVNHKMRALEQHVKNLYEVATDPDGRIAAWKQISGFKKTLRLLEEENHRLMDQLQSQKTERKSLVEKNQNLRDDAKRLKDEKNDLEQYYRKKLQKSRRRATKDQKKYAERLSSSLSASQINTSHHETRGTTSATQKRLQSQQHSGVSTSKKQPLNNTISIPHVFADNYREFSTTRLPRKKR